MFEISPQAGQSSLVGSHDGLDALTNFARRAAGADILLAFQAGTDGVAQPLAASPDTAFTAFNLSYSMLDDVDWTLGPVPAASVNLPSTILGLLDRPPARVWLLPAPVPDAPGSGMLFIWLQEDSAFCDCQFRRDMREQLSLMVPVFAQMLNDRSRLLRKRMASQRFDDLLGSVPSGVVIIEGDGQTGLINAHMAALLGTTAGEKTTGELAVALRTLRQSCVNADALAKLYGALQRDLNYEVRIVWDLGGQKLEVDTHPILGSGRNGRIWLFQDVTAQHILDENLRKMALTDALTGLSNRRHFFAAAEALLSGPASELPAAALMMDIDHFKSINDRYGHQAGDAVLREIATRLQAVLRQEDLLARIGGEEFAVMLSGLTVPEIIELAERLLAAVSASPVATPSALIDVRVSIGAVQRLENEPLDVLLQRADLRLYAAKAGGRNRLIHDFTLEPGGTAAPEPGGTAEVTPPAVFKAAGQQQEVLAGFELRQEGSEQAQ